MTSLINPNSINGAYPVAGQDNNSQGFRDNFTNTATNFQYAAAEITDLQNKAVLKAALTGTSINNDMLGSPLSNAVLADMAWKSVSLGNLSGTATIDYSAGSYYSVGTAASITLAFTNWPATSQTGIVQVQITVSDPTYTVTLPAAVNINTAGIQGLNTSTNVLTFAAAGVYTFTFVTQNTGTSIAIYSNSNQLLPYNNSQQQLTSGSAASLATTATYFSTTSASTGTLAAGVNGQIKTFAMTSAAGNMVITVSYHGWAGAGTMTFTAQGQACTLQCINNYWYCIGNNGVTFA